MNNYTFRRIASILASEPAEYTDELSKQLSKGISYPSARELALKSILGEEAIPTSSNSILALEYHKALIKLKSQIEPHIIKRIGSDYHDDQIGSALSSATAIRKAYFESQGNFDFSKYIPSPCNTLIRSEHPIGADMRQFEQMLFYKLRSSSPDALSQYREIGEGLENRIYQAAMQATSYEELLSRVKSKRYTSTRVSRCLLNIFLGIKKDFVPESHLNYLRVLGFDGIGQEILKSIKHSSTLSILTNMNHIPNSYKENPLLTLDCRATDLYSLQSPISKGAKDLTERIILWNL